MDDYPSNSHRQKTEKETPKTAPKKPKDEEPKKVEKVTSGDVVRRKKPLSKRFKELFVGEDSKGVLVFVLLDVMVPAAKDMFADAVSQGIERKLYGEARSTSRRTGRRPSSNGHVSYNRYSNTPHDGVRSEQRSVSRRAKTTHDFDEIILATRGEAEEVVDRLFDLVSLYETATVADLYELVGVTGSYTDDKWGWTELRGAGVSRVRNGYLLDLPRPEPID